MVPTHAYVDSDAFMLITVFVYKHLRRKYKRVKEGATATYYTPIRIIIYSLGSIDEQLKNVLKKIRISHINYLRITVGFQ